MLIRSMMNKFLIAFTFFIGLLFILINLYEYDFHTYVVNQQLIGGFSRQDLHFRAKKCILPRLDPWDPEVVKFLLPDWNPSKNCKISRIMHTELKNGSLQMIANTTSECKYRCLYKKGELDFTGGKWIEMIKNETYYESCDFIETYCWDGNQTTFRYVHVQVIKPKQKQFQKEDNLHPGVFLLIFDSTSSSSGVRTIMETNQVLRQFYDAKTFYYHNKAGLNSRPNAYAMFTGSRITELDSRRFPNKSAPELSDSCKNGVNRNETVTYDFVDQNYASIIVEDWVGAFNWPNCRGYGDPPTDHYGGALILRSADFNEKVVVDEFNKHYYQGECHERYHKLMDYVGKFLNEYRGISKFVVIWLSMLAHDSPNGLYHTDKFFANFFRRHFENLNNTFIFVMGDHGLRFGGIRQTRSGTIEDNNPLLVVAVPKYLRSNEQLILNLVHNSRKHTSQYDFFATLYDIARYARKNNYQKWDEHDFREEFGEIRGAVRAKSLLRPITYDRTCEEMEIPEDYCVCVQNWHTATTTNENVTSAARILISDVNDYLKRKNLDQICETLSLNAVISAEYLEEEPVLKLVVTALPSNGKYGAQLIEEDGSFKVITVVTRLDEYGDQGHCAMAEDVRPLCYCRQQLTTVTTK